VAVPELSVTRASRFLVALLLTLGLAGCGVSASDSPVDEGDAAAGGTTATDTEIMPPPSPDTAGTADRLVEDFLMAASGGRAGASDQVKSFLTDKFRAAWPDPGNPSLTVVRVVRGPVTGAAVTGRGTPVTVDYQVVGLLTDQGRINELADLTAVRTMVFWVVPDVNNRSNLRVDEFSGAPGGLILSDQALIKYYRPQPIYFWDQANTRLVPDLRYVPLTITATQRASQLVQWLAAGPSAWLIGGAQGLPVGTSSDPVVSENGTLVVKLSPQAASGGPDGLRRLLFQLQWSLRTPNNTPRVALSIDDTIQQVDASEQEYLQYNLSNAYEVGPQRYDITADLKVVPVPEGAAARPVLAAAENANVVSAAIGAGGTVAAFVRSTSNGRRVLQIVHEAVGGKLDANLPQSSSLGRPAFVPGAGDVLLIATGGPFGRLYRVSTTDGSASDVTPRNLSGVSAVSVSPDGRRVALIAGGQAYVSSLSVVNNTVTVGSSPRPILANQLTPATAVAWTDEAWLYVAGTSGGAPAMWHVTADSVVAENVSESVKELAVQDLVAYPKGPGGGSADVLAYTPSGIYTYFRQLTPPEQPLRAPFFGTP
jgi:Lipoprotein LpqB beta-propeller domain